MIRKKRQLHLLLQHKYFKLAESLGGVKSLLCHPAQMTHKSIPAEKRRAAGVADSLIRLIVGLEEAADLDQGSGTRHLMQDMLKQILKHKTVTHIMETHHDNRLTIGLVWFWCCGRRVVQSFATNTFAESHDQKGLY